MANRLGEYSFCGPASSYSYIENMRGYVQMASPLAYGVGCSPIRQKMIPARVVRLFNSGCPVAVFWRVPSHIVTSFNRIISRGTHSHVFQKCRERTLPALTNINATSAVMGKGGILWVYAPLNHTAPTTIGGSSFAAATHAMPPFMERGKIFLQASAASRIPCTQIPRINGPQCSTLTTYFPCHTRIIRYPTHNGKPPKYPTCQINQGSHNIPPHGILGGECAATLRGTEASARRPSRLKNVSFIVNNIKGAT